MTTEKPTHTHCIGCGCTDTRACLDDNCKPCHWLRVDRERGRGVCSECTEFLPEWDNPDPETLP